MTERCDHRCVMCSQPPREADDAWLVDDVLRAIPLVSSDAREIGITGGEPTLLGERLVAIVASLRDHLPATAVHLLSHGRRFADRGYARALAAVNHPDLVVGIPLYGDLDEIHDHVVQHRGAFDETIRGVIALKRARVRVELRCVVHALTVPRLPDLARFIARNLTFVDHVAFMGLEPIGLARTNLDSLWIDPLDYGDALTEATLAVQRSGMVVSLYGHQLCVLPERLRPFARRSISDWKNIYLNECEGCAARDACGGFFASSLTRHSHGISPIARRVT